MKPGNFLSGLAIDRAAAVRSDPEQLDALWRSSETRVLPVWRSKHLARSSGEAGRPEILFVSPADLDSERELAVLLGISDHGAYFAVDLSRFEDPAAALGSDSAARLAGLRELAPLVTRAEGALLAYAGGILGWHRRHRFCGVCGAETRPRQGGHVRTCVGEDCGEQHFPRTDPAVIMLVTEGERCLLGRQSSWSEGVYSTLAGFVEPGESLEEAVQREVREETGIELASVRYHSSQPWPFPSSLMLGFTADAKPGEIRVSRDELEDARWFTKDQVRNREGMELPSTISIARRLIEDWLDD